jgi:hypothetical protein
MNGMNKQGNKSMINKTFSHNNRIMSKYKRIIVRINKKTKLLQLMMPIKVL